MGHIEDTKPRLSLNYLGNGAACEGAPVVRVQQITLSK